MKRDRDAHTDPSGGRRRDIREGGQRSRDSAGRLSRLRDLPDIEVADGYPDIRGWAVKTSDGTTIGEVEDLVVDPRAMRVRYLDVALDQPFRNATHTAAVGEAIRQASRRSAEDEPADAVRPDAGEGHTLIPVGGVRLDDRRDEVIVEGLSSEEIVGLPRYGGLALTDEYESAVRNRLFEGGAESAPSADDYEHEVYDDRRLFAGRRPPPPGTPAEPAIGEEEVRVPLVREEVVASKQVVPREEIIVRTREVTEERTVEADLRRERAEVDDAGLARDAGGPSAGRARGAADDVRDRVDGDPITRPRPDEPERRA